VTRKSSSGAPQRSLVRRLAVAVAWIAGGLAALAVLWLLSNALLRTPDPPPLFQESDLPALPPEQDNGWVSFQAQARRGPATCSKELHDLLDPSIQGSASRWQSARDQRGSIVEYVSDARQVPWIRLLEDAMAKPFFADACPIDPGTECAIMVLYRTHDVLALDVLARGLGGDWKGALSSSARMLRADASYLASTRELVAQMVALSIAHRSMVLIDVLLDGYEESLTAPEAASLDRGALEEIAQAAEGIRLERIDLKRSVVAHYVWWWRAIRDLSDGRLEGGRLTDKVERLLLDRGQTLVALNEQTVPLAAYAANPSGPEPPERPLAASGAFWWLHNPTGKRLLDGLASWQVRRIRDTAKRRSDLLSAAEALTRRCGTMLEVRR